MDPRASPPKPRVPPNCLVSCVPIPELQFSPWPPGPTPPKHKPLSSLGAERETESPAWVTQHLPLLLLVVIIVLWGASLQAGLSGHVTLGVRASRLHVHCPGGRASPSPPPPPGDQSVPTPGGHNTAMSPETHQRQNGVMHVRTHTHTCMHSACTHIHSYAHTCIHAYTHTHTPRQSVVPGFRAEPLSLSPGLASCS